MEPPSWGVRPSPAPGTWTFTPDPVRRGPRGAGWAAALAGWAVVEAAGLVLAYYLFLTPDSTGGFLTGWGLVFFGGGYLVTLLAWTGVLVPILNGLLTQLAGEDRVEITATTLVHTRRRGPAIRRRSAGRAQVRGVGVSADAVTVRIGLADVWTLTELGVPAQRAALVTALSAWVPPAPPRSDAGPLPHLPRGWFVETVGTTAGLPVLRARVRPAVALRRGLGLGLLAVLLGWWGAALLLHGQDRVLGWFFLAMAASGTLGALGRVRRADAWEVGAGFLRVGRAAALSGRWVGVPKAVVGLRIVEEDKGDGESSIMKYVVLAVVDPDTVELFAGEPRDGSAHALGSWLAARARLPLEDRTRTPR